MSMCEWPIQLYGYDVMKLELLDDDVEGLFNLLEVENELLNNGLGWASNGDDSVYVGVFPEYQWQANDTSVKSLEEAKQKIYDFLKKYFEVEEDIVNDFDYISDVGWG